ncbi:MAG: DUF742 domain-containing protein [Frankia sp.]
MSSEDEWLDEEAGPVVRPYAVTGGRTRSSNNTLELVALLRTTERGFSLVGALEPEQHSIAMLCRRVQSIAEVSARLQLPIGVTRVLVGDMIEAGLVSVHRPDRPTQRPATALMERVLNGLQTL